MTPKISILITSYNYEKYIGQAIDSALAQTHPEVEVIVIDDGSRDGSPAVIRSYGDRIKSEIRENGGQASALNRAFELSTGDIIMLLDSDDFLHPEAAAKIAAAWTPETGMLHHRLRFVDREGRELPSYDPEASVTIDSGDVLPIVLKKGCRYVLPPTSGRAYSRQAFQAVSPLPKEFVICPDAYLATSVPFFTHKTIALDDTLAYYRMHGGNAGAAGVQRRTITRSVMAGRFHYVDLGWNVAYRLAKERNLDMPPQEANWQGNDAFDRFLYELSGPVPMPWPARIKRMATVVGKLSWEPTLSKGRRVRSMVLAFITGLAPKSVLRRMYPGLFTS